MLVQLNNGKIMSLDAVTVVDVKDTKIYYTLNNNIVLTEVFDTEEEVRERLIELFDFNYQLDQSSYNEALNTANRIRGN